MLNAYADFPGDLRLPNFNGPYSSSNFAIFDFVG